MELKELNFSETAFMANGTEYFVKSSLSVERFRWFEKYQVNFGFARDFKTIYDNLKKSIDLANKGKGVEAWNCVFNLYEQVGKIVDEEKAVHQAFLICALFICTEDEDVTQWDENKAIKKIEDWNREGITANSFFQLAANLVNGYIDALEEISRSTSELVATAKMEEGMSK